LIRGIYSALHAHHSTCLLSLSNTNLLYVPFVLTSLVPSLSYSVEAPKPGTLSLQLSECALLRTLSAIASRLTVASRPSNPFIASLFLRLRFGFCRTLCAFIDYIYLFTYLLIFYFGIFSVSRSFNIDKHAINRIQRGN